MIDDDPSSTGPQAAPPAGAARGLRAADPVETGEVVTALALVALLVLIALNGFFVAAEFALVRTRRNKIEQMAEEGAERARLVLKQLDRIDEYLSACQVGITMASIGIGFLGEPAIADLIEPLFGGLSHGVAAALAFAIAFTIATSLHITAGEQVPKLMAISRAERTARHVARPLDWFSTRRSRSRSG